MKQTLHHNKSLRTLTFLAALLFISCLQDKEIEDSEIEFPTPVELISVQLIGQVLDDDGNPAAGAEVEITSHFLSATLKGITNQEGFYFFPEFTNRGEEVLVLVNHADHFQGLYAQKVLDENSPVILSSQLTRTNPIASFRPENGIKLNVDNVLQIEIEPNTFESHVGEIQLSVQLIPNHDPENYLREINGRGFLNSEIKPVDVDSRFTLFIDFTDGSGGNPVMLKNAYFTLALDNTDWLDNYQSVDAYRLLFSDFNYWLESGNLEITGNEIRGSIDMSGIWTIGGRVEKHLSISGNLITADDHTPLEGKIKLVTEDGLFQRINLVSSNGMFLFDDVQAGRDFSLKFFNSCDEEIHSYGPISIFESTDLGNMVVYDVLTSEVIVDARDCDDNLRNAAFLRITSREGKSYFRTLSGETASFNLPLCGDQKADLSFLDINGNTVFGPVELDLHQGRKQISDPYNCFDPKLSIEADFLMLSAATGDTVDVWKYTMTNPQNRLISEVSTGEQNNLTGYRIKGANDCFRFDIHVAITSGKVSNVFSQQLEFLCFDFNYDKQNYKLGLTGGYPAMYEGGDFVNQINILDFKNEDTGELYDMLIEFRSSRDN